MKIKNPTLVRGKQARWVIYSFAVLVMAILLSRQSVPVGNNNGFDLSATLVPADKIFHGGPGRDGIPAIDNPRFVSLSDADFLKEDDRVLGLVYDGVARAYPVKILNYHEIVNDRVNGHAVVISYCPLCGSGMAFKPEFDAKNNRFGVSGLLYNSDMLLYDRNTESLWSQIIGTAISGQLKGTKLQSLVLMDTSWAAWVKQYPGSKVLSTRTGYFRDYDRHPYGDYDLNAALYFPVSNKSARYHPKERVIGLEIKGQFKVYPFSELAKQRKRVIPDQFAGQSLHIQYDDVSRSAVIYDENDRPLAATTLFWFAWVAFHPETEVYTTSKK